MVFESSGRANSRAILAPSVRQQILTGEDTEMGLEDLEFAATFVPIGTRPPQTKVADAFFRTTKASSCLQIFLNARPVSDGAADLACVLLEEAMVG